VSCAALPHRELLLLSHSDTAGPNESFVVGYDSDFGGRFWLF